MSELEQRINDLEIRLSHQARILEDLDKIVIEYHERLVHLERENSRMRQLLEGLGPELQVSPDE